MWEAAADLTFRKAAPDEPADIVIGAQVDPEGWAFANLSYDAASPLPIKPISRALICLNPERLWKVGFGANDVGLASALGVLLFLLVVPAMVFNIRRFRAEEITNFTFFVTAAATF